jgi:hypothetical protein
MDCYKLIVTEDSFGSSSSREVIIQLMRKLWKELHKIPNSEMGVMYQETDVFPKEYYFVTSNNAILSKIKANCKIVPSDYPTNLIATIPNFSYLGSSNFFPPKL